MVHYSYVMGIKFIQIGVDLETGALGKWVSLPWTAKQIEEHRVYLENSAGDWCFSPVLIPSWQGVKVMNSVQSVKVEVLDNGSRRVTVEALFGRSEDIEADDVAKLVNLIDEASGGSGPRKEEEAPKTRRRRSTKAEEPEKAEEKEEPEEGVQPRRRRRSTKAEEPAEEPAEEEAPKTRRRRRTKKVEPEDTGPTAEDVAKAASDAAKEFGAKFAAEIIADYSDTGNVKDIPADKRQAFIDEVKAELEAED